MTIKYPNVRRSYELLLKDFGDSGYQKANWLGKENLHTFDDACNELINFFDEEETLKGSIGYIFYDWDEARMLGDIVNLLVRIIDEIGDHETYDKYMENKEWEILMTQAYALHDVMISNDQKYGYLASDIYNPGFRCGR